MNLARRRILYLSFFAAFAVVAPILIIYTAGYRFDFKKNQLQKTGILYIDSMPQDAQIYLDGQHKAQTPKRFTYLLPNEYYVEVKKDGFRPWQKKLEVKSNLTTFNRDIILFRDTLPTSAINGTVGIFEASPSHQKILYTLTLATSTEMRLLNLTNQSDFLINTFDDKTSETLEFITWSPSKNRALVRQTIGSFNHYLMVDVESLRVRDLLDTTKLNFDDVAWGRTNDSLLYGRRGDTLYRINLSTGGTETATPDHITDFLAEDTHLYYISAGREAILNRKSLTDETIAIEQIKLPSTHFKLRPAATGLITLLDTQNGDLFLIDTQVFTDRDVTKHVVLQDKAAAIMWSDSYNRLLYYTDFELWAFDAITRQKYLITRHGDGIERAVWYLAYPYIIFQTKNELHAIEALNSETKVDTKLAELTNMKNFAIDPSGKNLYITGSIGSKNGIFQLALQ